MRDLQIRELKAALEQNTSECLEDIKKIKETTKTEIEVAMKDFMDSHTKKDKETLRQHRENTDDIHEVPTQVPNHQALLEEITLLSERIKNRDEENTQLKEAIEQTALKDKEYLKNTTAAVKRKSNKEAERIKSLTEELETTNSTITRLTTETEKSLKTITLYKQKLEENEGTLSDMTSQLRPLKKSYDENQDQIKNLNGSIVALKREISDLKADLKVTTARACRAEVKSKSKISPEKMPAKEIRKPATTRKYPNITDANNEMRHKCAEAASTRDNVEKPTTNGKPTAANPTPPKGKKAEEPKTPEESKKGNSQQTTDMASPGPSTAKDSVQQPPQRNHNRSPTNSEATITTTPPTASHQPSKETNTLVTSNITNYATITRKCIPSTISELDAVEITRLHRYARSDNSEMLLIYGDSKWLDKNQKYSSRDQLLAHLKHSKACKQACVCILGGINARIISKPKGVQDILMFKIPRDTILRKKIISIIRGNDETQVKIVHIFNEEWEQQLPRNTAPRKQPLEAPTKKTTTHLKAFIYDVTLPLMASIGDEIDKSTFDDISATINETKTATIIASRITGGTVLITLNDTEENRKRLSNIKWITIAKKRHTIRGEDIPPVQCRKCFNFGHAAQACQRNATCGKCAGPHWTSDHLGMGPYYCCNCQQTGHPAWAWECPKRKTAATSNRAQIPRKQQTPTTSSDGYTTVGKMCSNCNQAGHSVTQCKKYPPKIAETQTRTKYVNNSNDKRREEPTTFRTRQEPKRQDRTRQNKTEQDRQQGLETDKVLKQTTRQTTRQKMLVL